MNDAWIQEEEVFKKIKEGCQESFNRLFYAYFERLLKKAEAILGNDLLAEDCVQEVFLDLWKRRHRLVVNNPDAYLSTSIRFKAIDIIRRNKLFRNYTKQIIEITGRLFSKQPEYFNELEKIFQDTLKGLPKAQREAFLLSRENGLTYTEIAAYQDVSIKTVERRMSATLQSLRNKLGSLYLYFV